MVLRKMITALPDSFDLSGVMMPLLASLAARAAGRGIAMSQFADVQLSLKTIFELSQASVGKSSK